MGGKLGRGEGALVCDGVDISKGEGVGERGGGLGCIGVQEVDGRGWVAVSSCDGWINMTGS